MESKIEFKGCKYAVEDVNGFVMQFNSEPKITLNGIGIDDEMFFHDIWTLHTNPDHKESKEMNKHILLVMKYLDDKNSVSKQELKENADDAVANAAANDAATYAAYAVANAAAANAANAEKWINSYFDHTEEDKQTYIDAINAGKESKEMKSDRLADEIMEKGKESVYTQEMKDKDLVPTEGMRFTYRKRDEEYTVLGVCESQNGKSTIITFEDFRNSIDCIYYSDDVLPIDQRTDSEKAVDDLMSKIGPVHYDAHIGNMSLNDVVKFAVELIEKGDVTGISFTGDKK
jgi:hypothetical protein